MIAVVILAAVLASAATSAVWMAAGRRTPNTPLARSLADALVAAERGHAKQVADLIADQRRLVERLVDAAVAERGAEYLQARRLAASEARPNTAPPVDPDAPEAAFARMMALATEVSPDQPAMVGMDGVG